MCHIWWQQGLTAGVSAVTPWRGGCHPHAGELSWFCASDVKPAQRGGAKVEFSQGKVKIK